MKKIAIFIILVITSVFCPLKADLGVNVPGNCKNPQAIKEVLAGKRKVGNVAWWGFEKEDSTNALQSAINSGVEKLIVPYMGSDWIVRPIKLTSNQKIVFDPGVVVIAKKGEFKGRNNCLFSAVGKKNIILRGYGVTLKMQKNDYTNTKLYEKSEWRMGVALYGCSDVQIYGLTIEDTGGDGIYVGGHGDIACKDIKIKDCICDNNYRQGISIISAENLLIDNCILRNTNGTGPSAGIDLEPNNEKNKLINVVISNCVSENNAGSGISVYLRQLSAKSANITILIVNSFVRGCKYGFVIGAIKNDGPGGLIEFKNCSVENTRYAGAVIFDKSATRANLKFSNCKWRNVATQRTDSEKTMSIPIHFYHRKKIPIKKLGGVEFSDCYIYDEKARPFLLASESNSDICDISGNINIFNSFSTKMVLKPKSSNISLKVNTFK